MASNKFGDRAVERLIVTIVWWACHVATSASLLRYCVSTSAKIEDQKVQKQIFMKTKVAWTRRLHPQKNPNVLFERCEQPIDVKAGLKIPANSSVWLDFRGEKSPQLSPLWLLQQWTRAELISLKKNLPYDCCWYYYCSFLARGRRTFAQTSCFTFVFSKLGSTEAYSGDCLASLISVAFQNHVISWSSCWEVFFLQRMEITVVFHKLLFFTYILKYLHSFFYYI